MTTKTKAKKMTFRQRLRTDAEERLDAMIVAMADNARVVCKARKTEINSYDVMQLLCASQTKSLRHRLITELANERMAELEAIYNRQQHLDLETDNDSSD